MAIISFWSLGKKETGQSLSMAATMTSMAVDHNFKILGLSTEFMDKTLETCFFDVEREAAFKKTLDESRKLAMTGTNMPTTIGESKFDQGLEGLIKLIQSNRITQNIVKDYAKVVFKDRLDIIQSPGATDMDTYVETCKMVKTVAEVANRDYNMVFIDVDKSLPDNIARELLEASDIVVVNMIQDQRSIRALKELREKDEFFKGKNIIILVGRYDRFSRFNTLNITRDLKEKKEISAISYNTIFFEASEDGTVADFFLRYRNVTDKGDRNRSFMDQAKKTCDAIVYKLQELQLGQ